RTFGSADTSRIFTETDSTREKLRPRSAATGYAFGRERGPRGEEEAPVKTIGQQLVAEVVGTFALVFIGAGYVIIAADFGGGDLVAIALAHGLVLAIMVSSLGHISGGHFNPAVTLGAWVAGKIETSRAGGYIVAQLAGAAAGAGLLRLALPTLVWKN